MGEQSQHQQEKQGLQGLSMAVAAAHPLRARVARPPPSCLAVTWCPWVSGLSGSTVLLVTETMLLSRCGAHEGFLTRHDEDLRSLSCGTREARSPWARRGGARLCSLVQGGDKGLKTL